MTVGSNYNLVGWQTGRTPDPGYNNTQFVECRPMFLRTHSAAPTTNFALSLFSAVANRFLNLELSALEADGKGKIVSSPRVITADQVKALIEQGEELPYQVATASGATSIQFRKANLKLEGDAADHAGRQCDPGCRCQQGQPSAPLTPQRPSANIVKTRSARVENGGTVVIGGIYTQRRKETVNKVPLLGDVLVVQQSVQNKVRLQAERPIFPTPKGGE